LGILTLLTVVVHLTYYASHFKSMQALRKEPLTVYGDGKQTRSFQYVSDLVNFFIAYAAFLTIKKIMGIFIK